MRLLLVLLLSLASALASAHASAHASAQAPLVLSPSRPAEALTGHAGIRADRGEPLEALPLGAYRPTETLMPSSGSVPERYWARVPLRSAADVPTRWIVPLSLDRVTAVLVRADGRREVSRTGARVPLAERTFRLARVPSVRLDLAPREAATLFLRVESRAEGYLDDVAPVPVEGDAFAHSERRALLWNGLFLGVSLALAFYNLFLFGFFRDRSYLYYVLFLAASGVYWAITEGVAGLFLWPSGLVVFLEAQFFALALAAVSYVQFARLFLRSRQHAPRLDQALRAVVVVWGASALLGALGLWTFAPPLAAAAAIALLGVTFLTGVAALRAGFQPALAYLVAAGSFLVVGVGYAAFFLLDSTLVSEALPVLQAAMLVEALGLAVALSVRIRMLDGERTDALEGRAQAEAASDTFREANDLKTHLLGITAHDLRSPLTSIAGADEMIEVEAPDRPDLHDLTDLIRRGSARMLALIDDLLVTAALDGGQVELERAPVDVAALARDVVIDYAPRVSEKGQTLALDAPETPLVASVDAARVQAVLDNLVSNAVKYTPLGGHIAVACARRGADVHLRVSDDGPGLSADDVANLFQRFRRLSPAPTGGESSTGLGLSIAHEFVALHGGRIEVESTPGAGTTFTVVLPAEAPARRAETPRRASTRVEPESLSAPRSGAG